jgi:hypothetical protein
VRGQGRPPQRVSDGQRELGRPFEQTWIGGHERARRQRNIRRYLKFVRAGGGRMRQNAREVMMQCAALIVGIGGSMVVVATVFVDVVAVGMKRDVAASEIIGDVLLGSGDMLEMDGDQWSYAGNLGGQKEPEKPTAQHSSSAPRNHLIGLFARISTAGGGHNRARANRTAAS